jgi:hypothetical protein
MVMFLEAVTSMVVLMATAMMSIVDLTAAAVVIVELTVPLPLDGVVVLVVFMAVV